jgi:hypothetical protein
MVNAVNTQLVPKVTFEVTPTQKRPMDKYSAVNWSAVLRRSILEHAAIMAHAREIEAELNDPLVRELGDIITRRAAARYERALRARLR